MKTIIITDMDATFLDENYGFEKALPAYKATKKKDIPVCFCTSKTFTEIRYFENLLDQKQPFIAENGSVIYIPKNYFSFEIEGSDFEGYIAIELNVPHSETLRVLKEIQKQVSFPIHIYSEHTIFELKEFFNLPKEMAERSLYKKYADGFRIADLDDVKIQTITDLAKKYDFETKVGGRAIGINKGCDKGKATKILIDLFKKEFREITSIGVGDSPNDFPMLEEVDDAYLVQRPDGSYTSEKFKHLEGVGPIGWNNLIKKLK